MQTHNQYTLITNTYSTFMFQSGRENIREKHTRWHTSKQDNWRRGGGGCQQKEDKTRLMLLREIVAVYCENHMEHTHTLYGQNAEEF
jgi:hypothetical protein